MSLSLLRFKCYDLSKHVRIDRFKLIQFRLLSNSTNTTETPSKNQINKFLEYEKKIGGNVGLTKKERLKIIIRDYGKTVIVFHISISLISLGLFYAAVSSGIDITPAVNFITSGESEKFNATIANSSTFLIAYAIHKLFAPVRVSITLACTPLLVKYLRKTGILKPPAIKHMDIKK